MIYHAALPDEWDDDAAEYTPTAFSVDGFIHCSSATQLQTAVNRFLGDQPAVVVLWIDIDEPGGDRPDSEPGDDQISAALRWEPGSLGEPELFPHLYAPLPRRRVRHREVWRRAHDGTFRPSDLTAPLVA